MLLVYPDNEKILDVKSKLQRTITALPQEIPNDSTRAYPIVSSQLGRVFRAAIFLIASQLVFQIRCQLSCCRFSLFQLLVVLLSLSETAIVEVLVVLGVCRTLRDEEEHAMSAVVEL